MKNSESTTNSTHKDKIKINSLIHEFARVGLNLSRRDNYVFYKLLGFLLRNDKPFPYSNEKLALNTLYKISSIKEAVHNLEKLGLIVRTGFSYQRRLSKGKTLVNICIHSQYCITLLQEENNTHGQNSAGTSQKVAGTGQKVATIELKENLLKLKESGAYSPSTSNSKTLTPSQEADLIHCKKWGIPVPEEIQKILNG